MKKIAEKKLNEMYDKKAVLDQRFSHGIYSKEVYNQQILLYNRIVGNLTKWYFKLGGSIAEIKQLRNRSN